MLDINDEKLGDCDIVCYNVNGNNEIGVVIQAKKCLKLDGTTIIVTKKFVQKHQLRIVKGSIDVIAVRINQLAHCKITCRYFPACSCNLMESNKKYTRIKATTLINKFCPYYTEYYLQSLRKAK